MAAAPPDENTLVPDTRRETQYIPIALKVPKTVTSLLNVAVPVHVSVLASAVAPITPRVPVHAAFTIVVFPVTPRVPEHVAFARVVAPVTPRVVPIVQPFVTPREFNVAAAVVVRVAEEVNPLTARELAAAAPRFPRLRTLAESAKGSVAVIGA